MSRKALFANLGTAESASENISTTLVNEASVEDASRHSRVRIRPILGSPDLLSDPATTPVGAIGRSLGEFNERAKNAEEIQRKLLEGQVIIDLDPALIDPSFIADRMPVSSAELAELTDAIRQHGQFNPILVRPNPKMPGRFQVAFGHRRLRAVTSLGRLVKAVVRDLSDEQLVIAQGQENHERKDLSYIEKARFAHRLERRFSRATIMAALSIYKSDLSNMLAVVSKIPEDMIDAIGPAPAVGRRNWLELAELISTRQPSEVALNIGQDASFTVLPSDERFKRVLTSMKGRRQISKSEKWHSNSGMPLAMLAQSDTRVSLIIDRQKAPQFADFVLNQLHDLYLEFEAGSSKKP